MLCDGGVAVDWASARLDALAMTPTVVARSIASFQLRPCISTSFRGEKLVAAGASVAPPTRSYGHPREGFQSSRESTNRPRRQPGARPARRTPRGRFAACGPQQRPREKVNLSKHLGDRTGANAAAIDEPKGVPGRPGCEVASPPSR
jgi:hypothetical protein